MLSEVDVSSSSVPEARPIGPITLVYSSSLYLLRAQGSSFPVCLCASSAAVPVEASTIMMLFRELPASMTRMDLLWEERVKARKRKRGREGARSVWEKFFVKRVASACLERLVCSRSNKKRKTILFEVTESTQLVLLQQTESSMYR